MKLVFHYASLAVGNRMSWAVVALVPQTARCFSLNKSYTFTE